MINFGKVKPLIFILIIITCVFAESCKKPSQGATTGGGIGGTGTVSVTPTHLNLYIDSCTIYVKYGTLDAPADGIYDDSVKCRIYPPDTIPIAIFPNLKAGIYYFYGNGYHTGYSPPYVKGATNYTMSTEHAASIYLPTYEYVR